ncbi:MAG: Smr/MutS family protein [Clostridia bacterium]|nr:Smr/MutS family protein [Clostridia bacterium]
MNDPFVTIDLHGMMQAQAIKTIDRVLREAGPMVYQIRLIHGFHRGTSLRGMIQDEYRWHEKVLRIMPGDNPGITVLVLRELY